MSVNLDEHITKIKSEDDIFNKAAILRFLTDDQNIQIKIIAKKLGKSSSYVCNLLRILKLPELIRDGYYSKIVSPTHLYTLARLNSYDDYVDVYEDILKYDMSTGELEKRVRKQLHNVESRGDYADDEIITELKKSIQNIDSELDVDVVQSRIQLHVHIRKKGNLDDTNTILRKLTRKLQD